MAEIDDIIANSDSELSAFVDKTERRLLTAIKDLENKIIDAVKDGFPEGGKQLALADAQALHKELLQIVETEFNYKISAITSEYDSIADIIEKQLTDSGIDYKFSSVDRKLVSDLESIIENKFARFGADAADKIAQGLYANAAGVTSFSGMVDVIKGALTGLESAAGTPLASYAKTYASDSIMQMYSAVNLRLAGKAGLTEFLYSGNVSKNTRPFCAARTGRVFTKEQIDKWNSYSWKGKSCDVWICRGGYNCRHHLTPVRKEWIDNGNVTTGNYFDENPKELTPELKKAIELEKARL